MLNITFELIKILLFPPHKKKIIHKTEENLTNLLTEFSVLKQIYGDTFFNTLEL